MDIACLPRQLYLDLDGVLADFDALAEAILDTDNIYKFEFVYGPEEFWRRLNEWPTFFEDLNMKHDAHLLWSSVRHLDPIILTALPRTNGERVEKQKRAWVARHLGENVRVITCPTKDKPNYCRPGDVLVDDRAVNREAWMRRGGGFVVHTHTYGTLRELRLIGIL